jgi:amino acid transporter
MSDNKPHLAQGSLGALGSFVMAIGGTAPAFSISVASAAIIAEAGVFSVASVLYCGLIMIGLVLAFANLSKSHPSAGASYSWVSAIFSPFLGFLAGWCLLLSSIIFMAAAAVPAATSTLMLVASEYVQNTYIVSLISALWLSLITLVVIKGAKFAYLIQLSMLIIEIIIITSIIVGGFYLHLYQPAHLLDLNWILPLSISLKTFSTATTLALFLYWGWDVSMSLGEETKSGKSGIGAISSVISLILFFTVMMSVVLIVLTDEEIVKSSSNILFAVAEKIFPAPWSYIAILCTLLSTIGTIEAQIVQFSRCLFAMSRDRLLPVSLAKIHPKWQTPWIATLVIWCLGLLVIFATSFLPSVNEILKASISAIGLQICLYMSLTATASVWHYRKMIQQRFSLAVIYVLWPAFAALCMILVGVASLFTTDIYASLIGISAILLGICGYFIKINLLNLE